MAATFFGHPRGLATLFFTEMWERFGYYGMRALLVLYLTAAVVDGGMGMSAGDAGAIYALFTSLVYLLGLPGGWIADRVIGQRRAVLIGGIVLSIGYLILGIPGKAPFFGGLGLVVIGTGLLKTNVSVIVGQLYDENDERRDSGFSLFYMGINVGAFLGPILCSFLGEKIDWHLGFAAAGVGMIFGVIQYVLGGKYLGEAGLRPAHADTPEEKATLRRQLLSGLVLGLVSVVVVAGLFASGVIRPEPASISNAFGVFLLVAVVAFFAWLFLTGDWTRQERGRLIAVVAFFLAASFFWGAYEQAGSSFNLFAFESTNRVIAGWEFPAGWFQWVPALFVIIQAPLFAWLWLRMGARQPSSPAKFVLGLVFVGLGFVVMAVAAGLAAGGNKVGAGWLMATYFFHVVGEMCLSPVGLSTVTKLAPARVTGLMMGVWFLAAAVGNYLGGRVAGLYETFPLPVLFGTVAGVTVAAGLVLAIFVRPIRRLMGGVR